MFKLTHQYYATFFLLLFGCSLASESMETCEKEETMCSGTKDTDKMDKLNAEMKPYTKELLSHPVYASVTTMADLKIFMEHHIYCVWDFMSLLKYLQHQVAPSTYPWIPRGHASIRRFLNEMVLDEESDKSESGDHSFTSHFELYTKAMQDVGADSSHALAFVANLSSNNLNFPKTVAESGQVPVASKDFLDTTFGFVRDSKPHEVAAVFAYGRELIIPKMFTALLEKMKITREQAPSFYYYLERHIEVDGENHGPMAFKLVDNLCDGELTNYGEAAAAAKKAIKSRLRLWDGVKAVIDAQKLH